MIAKMYYTRAKGLNVPRLWQCSLHFAKMMIKNLKCYYALLNFAKAYKTTY